MLRAARLFLCISFTIPFLFGCGGSSPSDITTTNSYGSSNSKASLNKEDYSVFPDADSGADPAVSAEMGGKGFKGEGWETNTSFDLIGDPRAVKGGLYRDAIEDFPGTLRMGGPEWNTSTNYMIADMVYETLVGLDPNTLEYMPQLATHWQVSPDKLTYRFRIDPNAKFSNGQPVTSEDIIASFRLQSDKTLKDPALYAQFNKFEPPVAESKYIVRVKAKSLDWKNLLNFGTALQIFPASALKEVNGATYVEKFNFQYLPGTGPYIVQPEDIKKGNSLTLTRRKDYWAEKARWNVGVNNFDEVRLSVVRDDNLHLELFKKGDLDFYYVNRSKYWVQDLSPMSLDKVERGLIQRTKVFNSHPESWSGFAMNTQRPPLDDIRVRKALTLLLNRPLLIEKLFFNEYVPSDSYFPGTIYANPDNPKNLYDPQMAVSLLAEAGWKDRDSQGRLTKNGRPFAVEMLYDNKSLENILTLYQQELQKVGITLNLRLVTFETRVKLVHGKRQFDISYQGWGANAFPDPEQEYHSRLASEENNNNITTFKDAHADELMEKYGKSFDLQERVKLIRELDGLLANQYHYVFHWGAPFLRLAYWNKFGQPRGILTRTGDYLSDLNQGPGVERLWWIDPDKARKLDQATRDTSIKLPIGTLEDKYWIEHAVKEPAAKQ
jgi:microcin C transport system substrate-binding protein